MGRPQSLINPAVEKFNPDWIMFIFWHRLGSDAGLGMTGIQEEWHLALQMNSRGGGRPKVSVYFNQDASLPYELDEIQFEALKRFRDQIFAEHQALVCDFSGSADFEQKFSAHLIERLLDLSQQDHEGTSPGVDRLRREFLDASQGLLNWPNTLGEGQQIERPELRQLVDRFQEAESSTTLILGAPGSGKSALLATLGQKLVAEGIIVLAIKADMVGREVNALEDLREWLQFTVGPRDALRVVAGKERVVLLVDQLDAVSELLDRRSGRLNVLLNLIQSLSGTHNLHIVASSREFEFRHDVRLSYLDAERIDLALPTWEQIVPILEQAGYSPTGMGQTLRDLLHTPWHLKIFLDLASPSGIFESLHALLGALWDKYVVDAHGPAERLVLLEELASRMADEETLWLPVAIADKYPDARWMLEQAEILVREPHGQTIGFRHQSYYDYTLARAFARGSVSLAEHVLQRQDGLFVRPALLNGLNYLRSTARAQYHRELQTLMMSRPRPHIHTLLIEFLGSQRDPDDVEAALVLPLLETEGDGPRVLAAVAGSPGWFTRLQHHHALEQWMRRPPEQAAHCVPLLNAAGRWDEETVLSLLDDRWLADPAYDVLSLEVLLDLQKWSSSAVTIAVRLVRRSEWWRTSMLAEQIAASSPELAPSILRADLNRRLEQALEKVPQATPSLPPEASDQDRVMHELPDRPHAALERLIEEDHDWHSMEDLAEAAPAAFLESIWPWFVDVVGRIAYSEHAFVFGYRGDPATYWSFDGELAPPTIVRSLLSAISGLARSGPQGLPQFVERNASSDLLIVHRLLARGLELTATQEPDRALEYLLDDHRRLEIGDFEDEHRESKRLITALAPVLSTEKRVRLEETVLGFDRDSQVPEQWSAKDRFQRLKWTRQHRLRLLRAFPESCLSPKMRRFREEEERALPNTHERGRRISGGLVGPRLTVEEMHRASNEDLLRLFDELPDATKWEHPRRRWSGDMSRAGGAVELSRVFKELAKGSPERVASLILRLQLGRHETYAGAALEGLAESTFPTGELIELIEELEQRGFVSLGFQDDAASALEKLARKAKGLPTAMLHRLEVWLSENPEPAAPSEESEEMRTEADRGHPILFGLGGTFSLPHGRGSILRAIAAGYLTREPADLDNWARVIKSRLNREHHPAIWVLTLCNMPMLFNGDVTRATELYDAVIRSCPTVLRYSFSLYAIARVMGRFQPKDRVYSWLDELLRDGSPFCLQAYGELLMLYHCHHHDSSSQEKVRVLLNSATDPTILRGLAYAASHLWHWSACQTMAAEILCALAAHTDDSVQGAVAQVFVVNRDGFRLNQAMRSLIERVATCTPVLLKAAESLVETIAPLTGTEANLVARVCEAILSAEEQGASGSIRVTTCSASTLTDIALTLHRQVAYREPGLKLFEKILAMNVREARAALDLLDRRPIQTTSQSIRRKRRRR
ncbi:MAG: ATP-binding protein [Kofleriaceae bacterium]|nr:ATP-binding protein [Candidatus Methylomirabilis lanthanidiphila]